MDARKKIKTYLMHTGKTAKALAQESGLPAPVITRFIQGKRGMTVASWEKLWPIIMKEEQEHGNEKV